jgi:formate hydrogenlyase subunit 3/multisubunit Na+/H+ antiporter MnhD subunit
MYLFAVVIKAYFPGPGFSEELVSTVKDPEGGYMKVPMIILCITIVVLGVCSTPFVSYLERIASSVL